MAWSQRGNHRYFYRSVRTGARVTRQYCGRGLLAEEVVAGIERRRQERAAQASATRLETQAYLDAIAPPDHLCQLTDLLMRATLASEGYHQHARGSWRKSRVSRNQDVSAGDAKGSSEGGGR